MKLFSLRMIEKISVKNDIYVPSIAYSINSIPDWIASSGSEKRMQQQNQKSVDYNVFL